MTLTSEDSQRHACSMCSLGPLMMIVNAFKFMLMMIRKDTKEVRGGSVSV